MFEQFCFDCHDSEQAEAEINLESFLSAPLDSESGALLQRIIHVLEDERMPPPRKRLQPSSREREAMSQWSRRSYQILADRFDGDPGRVVMARLTPYEYRNVVEHLSGGVVTDAGRYLPNEGGAGEGFANVGEAQSMTPELLQAYLDAARQALRHLRVYPNDGFQWRTLADEPTESPRAARQDVVDEVIGWYGRQQTIWGNQHLSDLQRRHGMSHGLYLEAAWRFRWRERFSDDRSEVARAIVNEMDLGLSPFILLKWLETLSQPKPSPSAKGIIMQWRQLPAPGEISENEIRKRCRDIESWVGGETSPVEIDPGFAPEYELSFQSPADQKTVLEAAASGRWPFTIDVGGGETLYLLVTDNNDGNGDDYGSWHKGSFVLSDGSRIPWHEHVEVWDVRDERKLEWGSHPKQEAPNAESVGLQAPRLFQLVAPEDAIRFQVEFIITDKVATQSSLQALILKEKPKREFIDKYPNRYVFGGSDSRKVGAPRPSFVKFAREIRKRNVAVALKTKMGLNAERNVLADWGRTPIEFIGGPWLDQEPDRPQPYNPYFFTAEEARRVATKDERERLSRLEDRLEAIAQVEHQELAAFEQENGFESRFEGEDGPSEWVEELDSARHDRYRVLLESVNRAEESLRNRAISLITDFARKAWKRPIDDLDRAALESLYRESRLKGLSFDQSVKGALLLVMASADFIYHIPPSLSSPSDDQEIIPLNGYELAARLSFFVWGTGPDEALLEAAAKGALGRRKRLRAQVRRLVAHPRAESLVRDFGAQLFHFSDFDRFNGVDSSRFPEFSEELRAAMIEEVHRFLGDTLLNDRPLDALLLSRESFINRRLAEHYALSGEFTDAFVRTTLPVSRGGLATMGLFLTQSSLPLRTSPVQRGVWVLENLLGRSLPDPPPNVPSLSEEETDSKGVGIVQQLMRHRADPSCASCHDQIDPLGLALESFDLLGRIRPELGDANEALEIASRADEISLDSPADLKQYLESHREEFYRHFAKKLLGYGLGRAVGPGDERLLSRMVNRLVRDQVGMISLIEDIVSSRQFRTKRIRHGI